MQHSAEEVPHAVTAHAAERSKKQHLEKAVLTEKSAVGHDTGDQQSYVSLDCAKQKYRVDAVLLYQLLKGKFHNRAPYTRTADFSCRIEKVNFTGYISQKSAFHPAGKTAGDEAGKSYRHYRSPSGFSETVRDGLCVIGKPICEFGCHKNPSIDTINVSVKIAISFSGLKI
jgi:hypothetical protein